jgi:tRNA dimethylallyltransferase
MSGIGYREVEGLLRGELSRDTAMQLIHQRNHSYIRRQLTWWRKQKGVTWVDASQPKWTEQAEQLLAKTVV